MIDTLSANSLKILEKSKTEFLNKYKNSLYFIEENKEAKTGNIFHSLICYFLNGYDINKFEGALLPNEKEIFDKVKNSEIFNFVISQNKKFMEQPFLVKMFTANGFFYLTGRFDCVVLKDDKLYIIDWKMKNLPKNPEFDIQTLVYLFAASKLFNAYETEMVYFSLSNGELARVSAKENKIKEAEEKIKKLIEENFNLLQ